VKEHIQSIEWKFQKYSVLPFSGIFTIDLTENVIISVSGIDVNHIHKIEFIPTLYVNSGDGFMP